MMSDDLRALWRRVLLGVRRVVITATRDGGVAQLAQVRLTASEVRDDTPRLAEYGLASVPPNGSDAVALALAGDTSELVIIATGNRTYRLRGMGSGEVALHDDKGQSVRLLASGIVIDAPAGLTINGNTVFNGTVTANGHRIDETHEHSAVRAGTDTSGPVT